MEDTAIESGTPRSLPFILLLAVIQGWALYGLHYAIWEQHWPATDFAWLLACYGVALFIPTTLQLLAGFPRSTEFWVIAAAVATAYFYFGWHYGSAIVVPPDDGLIYKEGMFALGIAAIVLWLMVLPFVQAKLIVGHWNAHYPTLFTWAWHNHLMLAEAILFTVLFWLLLGLWAALFHMLDIDFFLELFARPIFIYPVTALTFGIALHLIGSIDVLTSVVLEQVLNVFKWLAIVAGVILVLFTLALVLKLPGLLASGERAIGAAWLLWLVAVVVLLLNAAYRDGTVARPYPTVVSQFLRWVVPLTIIVAWVAFYAVIVRMNTYGLTVARFWACVVSGAAVLYSTGYTVTVFARSGWLPGISRINVIVALGLILTIAGALTPVLSPYRLAANSQFKRAQEPLRVSQKVDDETNRYLTQSTTPFHYLRFEAGRYGVDRLKSLAALETGPEAARISEAAGNALKLEQAWEAMTQLGSIDDVSALKVYPPDRDMSVELKSAVMAGIGPSELFGVVDSTESVGLFVDLDGDSNDEFIVLNYCRGAIFARSESGWTKVGNFFHSCDSSTWPAMTSSLERGEFEAVLPRWRDLQIGSMKINIEPQD